MPVLRVDVQMAKHTQYKVKCLDRKIASTDSLQHKKDLYISWGIQTQMITVHTCMLRNYTRLMFGYELVSPILSLRKLFANFSRIFAPQ